MIEIKCTQEEKEALIACLNNPDNYCLIFSDCARGVSCDECLEKNIKWCVTDKSEV